MSIFDHILSFPSEASAHSTLDALGYGGTSEGQPYWDGSRVISGLRIITAEASEDQPEQALDGYWLAIALPTLNTTLRDLPNNACRLIANRDASVNGVNAFVYVSPAVDPQVLANARVAPVFAGSPYTFAA